MRCEDARGSPTCPIVLAGESGGDRIYPESFSACQLPETPGSAVLNDLLRIGEAARQRRNRALSSGATECLHCRPSYQGFGVFCQRNDLLFRGGGGFFPHFVEIRENGGKTAPQVQRRVGFGLRRFQAPAPGAWAFVVLRQRHDRELGFAEGCAKVLVGLQTSRRNSAGAKARTGGPARCVGHWPGTPQAPACRGSDRFGTPLRARRRRRASAIGRWASAVTGSAPHLRISVFCKPPCLSC